MSEPPPLGPRDRPYLLGGVVLNRTRASPTTTSILRTSHLEISDLSEDEEVTGGPPHKRSRCTDAEKDPSSSLQDLEKRLTHDLLRPSGKAGDELAGALSQANLRWVDSNYLSPTEAGLDSTAQSDISSEDSDDPFRDLNLQYRTGRAPSMQSIPPGGHQESLVWPIVSTKLMSYLPPVLPIGCKSIIYVSELLPRSFDRDKRSKILDIFRTSASSIPLCINLATGLQYGIEYHSRHLCEESSSKSGVSVESMERGWPSNTLPLEVFHAISRYLPRDDLRRMRLVNHEFESKISNVLFHTVVVPFRPEIYGIMVQQGHVPDSMDVDAKDHGRRSSIVPQKTVHQGMRTFEGWGPHIKRFAMAFEVEETTLETPPTKGKYEKHRTFWGQYRWPHPYYNRFEYCEDLEKKADEFRCMSAALSNLTAVTELGLSIDSGLGWLNGPDISDLAREMRRKPRIFGASKYFLESFTSKHDTKSRTKPIDQPLLPTQNGFYKVTIDLPRSIARASPNESALSQTFPISKSPIPRLKFGTIDVAKSSWFMLNEESWKERPTFSGSSIIPNDLTSAQKEWLMEIEWAQRAFISSFCMALADNSHAFKMVTKLNFARLSSRYLPQLQRTDFWSALHKLSNLTLNVSADWRSVSKDPNGEVHTSTVLPSNASVQFYELLNNQISRIKTLKVLEIGYVGGGEHQTGIFGRNRNILPAPVIIYSSPLGPELSFFVEKQSSSSRVATRGLLNLKYVRELTLTNCWFPPLVLKAFCTSLRRAKLRFLTLKSVSLCYQSTSHASQQSAGTNLGDSSEPQGPPRYGDPLVADFFDLRPPGSEIPHSDGWINTVQRTGSWGQVIDNITPGANLSIVRYAYQFSDDAQRPTPQSLESITFESCGYVYLTNFRELFQGDFAIDGPLPITSELVHRSLGLKSVTMRDSSDKYLGQIVTTFPADDLGVLKTGFPMVFGWSDSAAAKMSRQDGHALGGTGRFSGKVQRLTYSAKGDA